LYAESTAEPPNGLGLSSGAPLDRETYQADSWFKMAAILSALCAVRSKPLFGGGRNRIINCYDTSL
jgi:hypothetical protein